MNKISRHTEIALQFDEQATTRSTNHNTSGRRDILAKNVQSSTHVVLENFSSSKWKQPHPVFITFKACFSSQHSMKKRKQGINVGLNSWNRLVLCSFSSFFWNLLLLASILNMCNRSSILKSLVIYFSLVMDNVIFQLYVNLWERNCICTR